MRMAIAVGTGVAGLIISSLILAKPWLTIRHTKPITVKGYAEKMVLADTGSITALVTATGKTNAEAYGKAGESLARVNQLVDQVLASSAEVVELPTSVSEVRQLDASGNRTNFIDYYTATRQLRINSARVQALKQLGRSLYDLNSEGIHITVNGPEFFVSDLDPIKLELVEKATANGKERANLMAQSSGESLGSLTSAQQGVIQITKKNSTETSSWGIYDTETIEKVVKLVVTLEYEIGG